MSLGNGTRFLRDNGTELRDIADIAVELGSLSLSRETKESTYYSSEQGDYKSFYGGIRDAGESNIKMEFDRTEQYHLLLRADFESDELVKYGFEWPDAEKTRMTCMGVLTGFEVTHALGEKIYANCKIKWSGAPEWSNWDAPAKRGDEA